jgi:cyclohexanecarboxylate-CoA ligase
MIRPGSKRIPENTNKGYWTNKTLCEFFEKVLERNPEKTAVVDRDRRISFKEIESLSNNFAGALRGLGIRKGDVISYQLPNWYESILVNMATTKLGAIINPIVPIYKEREVSFILRQAKSVAIIIPDTFRGYNYVRMVERIKSNLPNLRHIIVLGDMLDNGMVSFDSLLKDDNSLAKFETIDPNDVKLLIYTSGTTSEPKGVQHTHNTIMAENLNVSNFWGITSKDVIFMPSPVTHITGYLYGLELPFILGNKVVLMDLWDPIKALDLMRKEKCSLTIGATPFLLDLLRCFPLVENIVSPLTFVCGGASVPSELIYKAWSKAGWRAFRVYGLTEAPTISAGIRPADSEKNAAETDGYVFGNEVKIVDDRNVPVAIGKEGEILVKGPEVFVGYKEQSLNNESFDKEGWFRTGDLGWLTMDGFLNITGRKKDIIIRGGENISAKEIEDLLQKHPSVEISAVVAMPDKKMGEKACAYVKLQQGTSFSFSEMVDFLLQYRFAKQKLPERLEIIDEFPFTPSGKIKKNVLREDIANKLNSKPLMI